MIYRNCVSRKSGSQTFLKSLISKIQQYVILKKLNLHIYFYFTQAEYKEPRLRDLKDQSGKNMYTRKVTDSKQLSEE